MDELHERMLEDLYTLIGFENAGREELCFFLRSAEEKALRFTRQRELIGGMPTIVVEIAADRFRRQGVGTAEAAQRVSSLSDNGQSVSFQPYAAEAVPSSGLTESEMQALCAYRKLW